MLIILFSEIVIVSLFLFMSNYLYKQGCRYWILKMPLEHIQWKVVTVSGMQKNYSGIVEEVAVTEVVKTILLILCWNVLCLLPESIGPLFALIGTILIGAIISLIANFSGSFTYEASVSAVLSANIAIVSGIYDNAISTKVMSEALLTSPWNVGIQVLVVFIPAFILAFVRLYIWRKAYPFWNEIRTKYKR